MSAQDVSTKTSGEAPLCAVCGRRKAGVIARNVLSDQKFFHKTRKPGVIPELSL